MASQIFVIDTELGKKEKSQKGRGLGGELSWRGGHNNKGVILHQKFFPFCTKLWHSGTE